MRTYTAFVDYPENPAMSEDSMPTEGATIEEAESLALADSAVNCPRVVTVLCNEDGRTAKGPYDLR